MTHSGKERKINRRAFLVRAGIFAGMGAALCLPECVQGMLIEPGIISLERIDIVLPGLAPAFDSLRIVQISDIHFDAQMMDGFILRLIATINQLKPDVIVFTGDFLGGTAPFHILSLGSALKLLDKDPVKLAILGNHDHFVNPYAVRNILHDAGIILLQNQVHVLRHNGSQLYFCGLDDPLWRKDDLRAVLNHLHATEPAILLVHEPDYLFENPVLSRFGLQLSGHTHGGQIVLPLIGPLFKPEMGKKFISGLYEINDRLIYVNRGLGQVGYHVRLNATPEVTLIRLYSPPQLV